MRVGIMGGTFDPIHNGHLALGASAYSQFRLDEVWFLPNGNPPHKTRELTVEDRMEMVRIALANDQRFRLNTYEMERKEVSYSYDTLEHFRTCYPENSFYFIVGADSLFQIESWKEPARVMAACTLLAACREEKEPEDMYQQIQYLKEKYDAQISFLKAPVLDISSSAIRQLVREGKEIDQMVPQSVATYIQQRGLYRE